MSKENDPAQNGQPIDTPTFKLGDDGELIEVPTSGKRKRKRKQQSYRTERLLRYLGFVIGLVVTGTIGFGAARLLNQSTANTTANVNSPNGSGLAQNALNNDQSLALANSAEQLLAANNADLALSLALQAASGDNPPIVAQRALIQSAYARGLYREFHLKGGMANISISRDSGIVASIGGLHNSVALMDLTSGKELQQIALNTSDKNDGFFGAAVSPDGNLLVTSQISTAALTVWDAHTGKELNRLEGHTGRVRTFAFSADSKLLLSGGGDMGIPDASGKMANLVDHMIRVWDLASGKEIAHLDGHSASIISVSFGRDSTTCFSTSENGEIFEWQISTGQVIHAYQDTDQIVDAGAVNPDGHYAAVGGMSKDLSNQGTLVLWQLNDNDTATPKALNKHTQQVSGLAFSPDGRYLASGGYDGLTVLWDVAGGKELHTYLGNSNRIFAIGFSPDGRYILSGSEGSATDLNGGLQIWSVDPSALLDRVSYGDKITALALSPDGKALLVGLATGDLILQDAATGRELRRFGQQNQAIASVAFSPDGKRVLVGTETPNGQLTLWNEESGEQVRVITGDETLPSFNRVLFSADGKTLLTTGVTDKALLWDADSGSKVGELQIPGDGFEDAAFSPDGLTALTASQHGVVTVWDVRSGKPLKTLRGDLGVNMHSVAFSPDGKLVAGGFDNGIVRVWDSASGQKLYDLKGQVGAITRIVFSPDGLYIVTASNSTSDNLILWQAQTGAELFRYPGHAQAISILAISPDGHTLFSGSSDKTLIAWALPGTMADLKKWIGGNRYVPELTCDERKLYSVAPLCSS